MKRVVLMMISALKRNNFVEYAKYFAILVIAAVVTVGCGKEAIQGNNVNDGGVTGGSDFNDVEDRIGLWVNPDRQDTLEFVNSSKLIRKGFPYGYEEYFYRIENNTLIISITIDDELLETYHPILKSEKNMVIIDNMYIGPAIVGADNSGTFFKLASNCDKDVIVSATEFENASNVNIAIEDMKIEGNCLKIKFAASGCDGRSWNEKLIAVRSDVAVYPHEWMLKLSFENIELCHAVITKEVSFNIEELQLPGNKVRLNIYEYDSSVLYGRSILYEY